LKKKLNRLLPRFFSLLSPQAKSCQVLLVLKNGVANGALTPIKLLASPKIGLDVIGDTITEINVTSPTCIRELDTQFNLNIAGVLFDAIEQKTVEEGAVGGINNVETEKPAPRKYRIDRDALSHNSSEEIHLANQGARYLAP
jgi:hypothetical protein